MRFTRTVVLTVTCFLLAAAAWAGWFGWDTVRHVDPGPAARPDPTRSGTASARRSPCPQARFRWGLGPAGQEPVVIGFDLMLVDADQRIRDVRGFLDTVPA